MRVISKSRLREFWARFPDAQDPLMRWYDLTIEADWQSPAEAKQTFGKVDPVTVGSGNTVLVFNIGGNKYRLIAAVHYDKARVFVLRVLTHREYDLQRWKDEI